MHLTVVVPGAAGYLPLIRAECERWTSPGTRLDVVDVPGAGPLTTRHGLAMATPAILEAVGRAAAAGSDGVFVLCSGDPAVHAAREVVDVPVAGGFQPSLLAALAVGHRVAVITPAPVVAPILAELVRHDGLSARCGTIRSIDISGLPLHDPDGALGLLHAEASRAVEAGEADVVVLGCTAFLGMAARLQERLAATGPYVPVVDPVGAALTQLESAVRLGVRPSRATYAPPQPASRGS
jgi:allantoin racemase